MADNDSLIVEGQEYTLYCPWGTTMRTTAVEIVSVEPDDADEYFHAQAENPMGDTVCIDSIDFLFDGTIVYLYDASVHFYRRHGELQFDPYEGVETVRASKAPNSVEWLHEREEDE